MPVNLAFVTEKARKLFRKSSILHAKLHFQNRKANSKTEE